MMLSTEKCRRPLVISTFFLSMVTGCFQESSDITTGQRRVSRADIPESDLVVQVNAGAVRETSSESIRARSSAPSARVTLSTGPEATGDFLVEVFNLHPSSQPRILGVQGVSRTQNSACADDTALIVCAEARAAIGTPCAGSDDCADGTTCIASTCEATQRLSACDQMSAVATEASTEFALTLPLSPCTSTIVEFAPAETPTQAKFVVIGSTSSLGKLESALSAAMDHDADFAVLLGENLDSADQSAVDGLEIRLNRTPIPVVFVASANANIIDEGEYALRLLGPHDFIFPWGPARFVTFFTGNHTVDELGLTRLDTFLRSYRRNTDSSPPVFAFTHTPPIDPNGIRNLGFTHRTQGARVLSLLNSYRASALFAGRINASDRTNFADLDLWITSAYDSVLENRREFLLVSVDADGTYSIEPRTF